MALSVSVTSAEQRNGRYYFRFADGFELEFQSFQKLRQFVRRFKDDEDEAKDFLRAAILAKYMKADPNGVAPSVIAGKTLTLDLALPRNILQVT